MRGECKKTDEELMGKIDKIGRRQANKKIDRDLVEGDSIKVTNKAPGVT